MLLVSLAWWLLLLTLVFAPRPRYSCFVTLIPASAVRMNARPRGQRALPLEPARSRVDDCPGDMPVIALTAFNLWFYSGSSSALSALGPVWLDLLIVCVTASITIFALAADD